MEVMDDNETSYVLSREKTFLMKILKSYFILEKNNPAVNTTNPVPNTIH